MPFTPVHLGPAALFKSVLGERFSFVVFGGSQVLIDIEPLVQIVRAEPILHGPSHTIAGATVIGFLAAGLGKPIGQVFLRSISYPEPHISWAASFVGAFVGTYSHILLDGIMHSDMSPWVPFATENTLLGLISVQDLHYVCLGSGVLGLLLLGLRRLFQSPPNE